MERHNIHIGPMPSQKRINQLRKDGFTHVISLLGDNEFPKGFEHAIKQHGLSWVHIPLKSGSVESFEASKNMAPR